MRGMEPGDVFGPLGARVIVDDEKPAPDFGGRRRFRLDPFALLDGTNPAAKATLERNGFRPFPGINREQNAHPMGPLRERPSHAADRLEPRDPQVLSTGGDPTPPTPCPPGPPPFRP